MVRPIIGDSPQTIRLRAQIDRIARAEINTLVTGETGVGKELVVRHLYHKSKRLGKPFIKINCAALPDTLIESELFGYKKGSFTGADQEGKGKFELANGGVLFLDEIGDMAIGLQAKILHVLQDGYFTPIGASESFKSDVWCIAATNRNIEQEVEIGNFRKDLLYRLNTVSISVEPLRDKPEDIPQLITYFYDEYTREIDTKQCPPLNDELIKRFKALSWPGNVRELQSAVKRYILIDDYVVEKESQADDKVVPLDIKNVRDDLSDLFFDEDNIDLKVIGKEAKHNAERIVITYVLNQTDWNKTDAAKILRISYKSLLNKITDFKIMPKVDYENKIISFPRALQLNPESAGTAKQ